jgi:hypothetical protein
MIRTVLLEPDVTIEAKLPPRRMDFIDRSCRLPPTIDTDPDRAKSTKAE